MSVVVDGMQVLHSLGDSSLQIGICKLTLGCMLQVLPRVCEQMHVHLHGQSRRRLKHMFGAVTNNNEQKLVDDASKSSNLANMSMLHM